MTDRKYVRFDLRDVRRPADITCLSVTRHAADKKTTLALEVERAPAVVVLSPGEWLTDQTASLRGPKVQVKRGAGQVYAK